MQEINEEIKNLDDKLEEILSKPPEQLTESDQDFLDQQIDNMQGK